MTCVSVVHTPDLFCANINDISSDNDEGVMSVQPPKSHISPSHRKDLWLVHVCDNMSSSVAVHIIAKVKSTCYRHWNSLRAENKSYVLVIHLFCSGKKDGYHTVEQREKANLSLL